jgi:FkbH-like protein
MKYQVFRNYTIELLFKNQECVFAGYSDISSIDETADRYIWFYLPNLDVPERQFDLELREYSKMFEYVLAKVKPSKTIVAITAENLFKINFDLRRIKSGIDAYNNKLYILSRKHSNLVVFDFKNFISEFETPKRINWKFYFTSKIPINPTIVIQFQSWFKAQLLLIEGRRKKCIVLDLDNTLWGGVLGEDGISGIRIRGEYPGNVFEYFQRFLLEIKRAGVILAICSKNNETDVINLFKQNPNLILSLDDFSAWEINWKPKSENINRLAKKLKIGLDSMIFIDDSPMEREIVRAAYPEVLVPEFPREIYNLPIFIKEISQQFQTYNITKEDLNKTKQYKENRLREDEKEKYTDLTAYLNSLGITLIIHKPNIYNLDRFVQLTQKTNQFNLTTRRYTREELENIEKKGGLILGLQVKDKFGDYGIVGLAIIQHDPQSLIAEIDTFLLSCRVLGKGVEFSFIAYALNVIRNHKGAKHVKARYIATDKNMQVEDFYTKVGFTETSIDINQKNYWIDMKMYKPSTEYNHRIISI